MALPEDFSKIYGSTATGGLTPISDVNYAKGWEFVGANPPTKNDFSYLQNLSDLKSQWLYSNKLQRTDPFGDIKSDGTVAQALSNLDIGPASLTTPGLVRLTSSRVSSAEDIAATASAVAQNYSDMKGLFGQCGMKSRNIGVVYTNSQSFAIFVSVNAVLSDGSSFLSANVSVDGNTANFRGSQTTNLAGQRATVAFMVPAGATYVVRQFSGTVSDVTWAEVDKK